MDLLISEFNQTQLEACRSQMPLNRKMNSDDDREMIQCFQKFSQTLHFTLKYIQDFNDSQNGQSNMD